MLAIGLALAALGGALALPRHALAQEAGWDETIPVEVDDVAQLGVDKKYEQKRLKVNAKLNAISGDQLIVLGNDDVPFVLDTKLVQTDVVGSLQLTRFDNIRAFGYLVANKAPQKGFTFLVKAINKRDDDLRLFRADIANLDKAGDMAGLFKLGEKIEAQGTLLKQPAPYRVVAREAYRAAVGLKEKALKPEDAAGWIALAGDYLKLLGDRQAALERLKKAIPPGGQPSPEAQAMLNELGASSYGGQWVLYEEMKQKQGFKERNGQWVRQELADFEAVIDAQVQKPVHNRAKFLAGFFQDAASKGSVLLGMNKEELAQAIGFPDDIERERRGTSVYDMWTYEGRGAYYFETLPGGSCELFRRPDAPK